MIRRNRVEPLRLKDETIDTLKDEPSTKPKSILKCSDPYID